MGDRSGQSTQSYGRDKTVGVARKRVRTAAVEAALQRNVDLRLLGEQVRHLRLDQRLSQKSVAKRARINFRHLGRIERAQTDPGADVLVRIARALNVAVGELFERVTPSDNVAYRLSHADVDDISTAIAALDSIVTRVRARTPRTVPARAPRAPSRR